MSDYLPYPAPNIPQCYEYWKVGRQKQTPSKRVSSTAREIARPVHNYYALELHTITTSIEGACSPIIPSVQPYSEVNPEVERLLAALNHAKTVPRGDTCMIAFCGEQGIGKSSLMNALLGRELVSTSAETKACTSIPTYILPLEGAPDDTKFSDVTIECMTKEEIADHIEQQIIRYTDLYPYTDSDGSQASDSDDSDNKHINAHKSDPKNKKSGKQLDEDERKKELDAETAKEFFEIIFDAQNDTEAEEVLMDHLENADLRNKEDIRGGKFFHICMEKARQCSEKVRKLHGNRQNVHDDELEDLRSKAEEYWPLVHAMYIATGHELLRHNLGFMDLPGYGDTNQLRNAQIDRSRDIAVFEIIVVPSIRVQTSTVQREYIDRSIRRRGPEKTLLVMNKSDELVKNILKTIKNTREEPFPTLRGYLETVKIRQGEDTVQEDIHEKSLLKEYHSELLRATRAAWIQHQSSRVQKQLRTKGLRVLPTSTSEYQLCSDEAAEEPPKLGVLATGIPALRLLLLPLPAGDNYENLKKHVFETLPDVGRRMRDIKVKYADNTQFEEMRQALEDGISKLRGSCDVDGSMDQAIQILTRTHVVEPYSMDQITQDILPGIKETVFEEWKHPLVHHATFAKTLRDTGVLLDGVRRGKNLNNEIVKYMQTFLEDWRLQVEARRGYVVKGVFYHITEMLKGVETRLGALSGESALQRTAMEEFNVARERIQEMREKLKIRLQKDLDDVHYKHTIETNIQDPMAQLMKPLYLDTMQFGRDLGKRRKRKNHLMVDHLQGLFAGGENPIPLLFSDKLVCAQIERWRASCNHFADQALGRLQYFLQATRDVVDHQAYATPQHQQLRVELEKILPIFEENLREIQRKMKENEDTPEAKRRKRAHVFKETADNKHVQQGSLGQSLGVSGANDGPAECGC